MKTTVLVLAAGLLTLLVGTGIATADSLCRSSSLGSGNAVVDLLLGQTLFGHYHVIPPCLSPETSCSGTCTDLTSDPNNCGSCDDSCGGVQPGCCSSDCTDFASDDHNCGSCGNDCTLLGSLFSCGGAICVCDDLGGCSSDSDCCPGHHCFDVACVSN